MNQKTFLETAGYPIEVVEKLRLNFVGARRKREGMWKVIDAYDTGDFWETVRKQMPKHQIIPDTNHINFIKENIINSIYAAPYIADVLPLDPADMEEARNINKFVEYIYNLNEVGVKQLKISNNTVLHNVGFLQCGWDANTKYSQLGENNSGGTSFTPRDILSVILDPNYSDLQEGRAVFINSEESLENLLAEYSKCTELVEAYPINQQDYTIAVSTASAGDSGRGYLSETKDPTGMLPVWIAFKKVPLKEGGYRIDQIIYTQGNIILDYKQGIRPNYFPIIPLYLTSPEKDGYGIGVCQRVLKNALSLNILNSIAITHTYAAQRTPWVFDSSSGLSLRRVQTDINNPDVIFPIQQGDPTKVLYRLEYPKLPDNLEFIKTTLEADIEKVSGVDAKYTGRDTASINTTGGMERLQQRVSMTDNTRITLIEHFAKELTKMIIDFHVENGGKYSFVPTNTDSQKEIDALSVDFTKYRGGKHKFLYSINASPLMPKSRARLAEAANIIMQVQMQYAQGGQQVQLLSPEEWLYFQDLPQKDMILDRMKLERLRNDEEEIASELTSFSAMTEEGMRPEAAVQQLAQERKLRRDPAVMKNILNNQK